LPFILLCHTLTWDTCHSCLHCHCLCTGTATCHLWAPAPPAIGIPSPPPTTTILPAWMREVCLPACLPGFSCLPDLRRSRSTTGMPAYLCACRFSSAAGFTLPAPACRRPHLHLPAKPASSGTGFHTSAGLSPPGMPALPGGFSACTGGSSAPHAPGSCLRCACLHTACTCLLPPAFLPIAHTACALPAPAMVYGPLGFCRALATCALPRDTFLLLGRRAPVARAPYRPAVSACCLWVQCRAKPACSR